MPTWFLLAIIALAIIALLLWKHSKTVVVKKAVPLGQQLRQGAESIPVIGQYIKAVGVVGHPVNQVLDKATQLQINALKHIPIIGNVAAKPLEIAKSGVDKLNSWLGL